MIFVILTIVALVFIARVWAVLDAFFSEYPHLWRLLSGNYLTRRHGREPIGRTRRLRRAGIRTSCLVGVVGFAWAYTYHRQPAILTLIAAAAALVVFLGWRVWRFRPLHHFRWVRPARRKVAHELAAPPTKFTVTPDRSEVVVGFGDDRILAEPEQRALTHVVCSSLALEAPDEDWRQYGRNHRVTYTASQPPPPFTTWEDVAQAVASAAADEVILGLGKKGVLVSASLASDSPHVGLNMGSGGGKTNLGSLGALQFLHRGDIIAIIDAKLISYPWARGLPNICYAGTIAEIHDLLVGLGHELQRRNEVSLAGLQPSGAINADVGPRIILKAEELNFVIPKLKRYWADLRQLDKDLPKRSPALDAVADIAFAGRQVKMHVWFIGQMLTAAATGASDSSVRGNIGIACMARYRETTWRTMSDLPMPPIPSVRGRIQVVTAAGIRETQVPYLYLTDDDEKKAAAAAKWAREYATNGVCTPLPSWMPGAAVPALVQQTATRAMEGPDQGNVVQQTALPPARDPGTVTLREAVEAGMWPTLHAARQARHRHKPTPVGTDGRADLFRIEDLQACRMRERR